MLMSIYVHMRLTCGFQSESKMMHVSAAVRLMPTPPARVEMRKAKMVEPGRE